MLLSFDIKGMIIDGLAGCMQENHFRGCSFMVGNLHPIITCYSSVMTQPIAADYPDYL